jgi:hypothetical protein
VTLLDEYVGVIRPGSGLIRRAMLARIRREAERWHRPYSVS